MPQQFAPWRALVFGSSKRINFSTCKSFSETSEEKRIAEKTLHNQPIIITRLNRLRFLELKGCLKKFIQKFSFIWSVPYFCTSLSAPKSRAITVPLIYTFYFFPHKSWNVLIRKWIAKNYHTDIGTTNLDCQILALIENGYFWWYITNLKMWTQPWRQISM